MNSLVRCLVRRDTYRDSVELMRVAAQLEQLPGVARAALLMGTPANRDLLAEAGLLPDDATAARPSDLVVAVAASDVDVADEALALAARLLSAPVTGPAGPHRPAPRTIAEAIGALPGANLAIISTPGDYATAEALKALKRGLHVFLFSNNVPLADEIELKRLAGKKGLLMMGPDCGTAILDGVPLGFANAVRRGRIGLVGASGTGLQQVSCLIDRLGEGVSQVIGVGGRDLDERVGGLMMMAGVERLARDPGTSVIGLISKPPAASVARQVLAVARASSKPVVVNFLGGNGAPIREAGATPADTLEHAAWLAVAIARGGRVGPGSGLDPKLVGDSRALAGRFAPEQRAVRGLFSGGTLCQEAALILDAMAGGASRHTTVDLGDDRFTVGRPHPMIDFRLRNDRIGAAAQEPTTAVILLDVILGYGAHADPAEALIPAIEGARRHAARGSRALAVVASVCGTEADPQGLSRQEAKLAAAGVILAPSNAQAARLAGVLAWNTTAG
ncbi:MAG TPA: acyl-CoA synthetase FdrA [Methylomirabilota bacterium]|jgi:succinyl-CoA synthetase alpha subunit|nr:acyl-CoA synthetase FdrA [Methylomirabilota bacterium]